MHNEPVNKGAKDGDLNRRQFNIITATSAASASAVGVPRLDNAVINTVATELAGVFSLPLGTLSAMVENSQFDVSDKLPKGVSFIYRLAKYVSANPDQESLEISFLFNFNTDEGTLFPSIDELYKDLLEKLNFANELEKKLLAKDPEILSSLSLEAELRKLIDLHGALTTHDMLPVYPDAYNFFLKAEDKYDLGVPEIYNFALQQVSASKKSIAPVLANLQSLKGFTRQNPNSIIGKFLIEPNSMDSAKLIETAKSLQDSFILGNDVHFRPKWVTPRDIVPRQLVGEVASSTTLERKIPKGSINYLSELDGCFIVSDGSYRTLIHGRDSSNGYIVKNLFGSMLSKSGHVLTRDSGLHIFRFSVDEQEQKCSFLPLTVDHYEDLYALISTSLCNADLENFTLIVNEGKGTIVDLNNFAPNDYERVYVESSYGRMKVIPSWDFLILEHLVQEVVNSGNLEDGQYAIESYESYFKLRSVLPAIPTF